MPRWIIAALLVLLPAVYALAAEAPVGLQQTRAWVRDQCPVADHGVPEAAFLAGLAKILIPAAIDKGIDLVAATLKKAGEDETTPAQLASADGYFYESDGDAINQNSGTGCLVIARGEFVAQGTNLSQLRSAMRDFTRAHRLARAPDFLLEARFKFSPDGQYFRLEPATLWYAKPIDHAAFGSDGRSVAITFSFAKAGSKDTFASAALGFPDLQPPRRGAAGTEYGAGILEGMHTGWMPVYPASDPALAQVAQAIAQYRQLAAAAKPPVPAGPRPADPDDARLVTERAALCALATTHKSTEAGCPVDLVDKRAAVAALQAAVAAKNASFAAAEQLKKATKPAAIESLGPFQVRVSMTETRKGSALAKFLGSVIESSKKELAAELKSHLPDAQEQAELTAIGAREQLEIAALNAKIAVQKKEIDIAAEKDDNKRKQLELDLQSLKYQANVAYRKAGLAAPYPGVTP